MLDRISGIYWTKFSRDIMKALLQKELGSADTWKIVPETPGSSHIFFS